MEETKRFRADWQQHPPQFMCPSFLHALRSHWLASFPNIVTTHLSLHLLAVWYTECAVQDTSHMNHTWLTRNQARLPLALACRSILALLGEWRNEGDLDTAGMYRPQSAATMQETELINKSRRSVAMAKEPLEKLRHLCLSRGATGILGLGR